MSDSQTLKISRQDLYELVWSKPMVELAKDLGLSDVGLAKHCRKLGVPTPGRGYWARVAAGQTPRQTPLKKLPESTAPAASYFEPPRPPPTQMLTATEGTPEYRALRDQILELELPRSLELLSASAPVKRTAVALKRRWHRDIKWVRGERTGAIVQVDVSDLIADRALRFCELLLAGARALNWTFAAPPKPEEPQRRQYGYRSQRGQVELHVDG